jgi:hypothetical protein
MRKLLHNIGLALFATGILAGGALAIVGFAYFAVVVAPFFWARGDYVPAALILLIGCIAGGGFLAAVTEVERKP